MRNALEALFDGVNKVEQQIGMTTSIPAGTRVLGIAVDDTTATVELSAEFERSSGSLDETTRLAQVVFTVTQFDGFDRVKFHVEGEPRDTILSHGFDVGEGLTRDDFADVRPTILIEQPYPGAKVPNPRLIGGESNTFEATVRYAITSGGGDGEVVAEGFTTASAGNGTWGRFQVAIDLTDLSAGYRPGPGSIIMWEDDVRDGGRLAVVEIPVVLSVCDLGRRPCGPGLHRCPVPGDRTLLGSGIGPAEPHDVMSYALVEFDASGSLRAQRPERCPLTRRGPEVSARRRDGSRSAYHHR